MSDHAYDDGAFLDGLGMRPDPPPPEDDGPMAELRAEHGRAVAAIRTVRAFLGDQMTRYDCTCEWCVGARGLLDLTAEWGPP